jgi:hypothetical protein
MPSTTTAQLPCDKPTLFESDVCTRCGGCGNYSWNAMTGSRCFKCGGRGRTMTKRGAEAQRFFRASLSKRADELQPGDKIFDDGVPGFAAAGWHEVERVTSNADERSTGRILKATEAAEAGATVLPYEFAGRGRVDGEVIVYQGLNVHAQGGGMSAADPGHIFRVAASRERKAEAREQALAYQETLTKQGKPRKR